MSEHYIFLSHCVRDDDPVEIFDEKLKLIEFLESVGHDVFDYVVREGNKGNWMKEIKHQFNNCSCLIYFAKQWPEPKPGVALAELSAAAMVGKPLIIYHRVYNDGPIFEGVSDTLCASIHQETDLLYTTYEGIENRLQGISEQSKRKSRDSCFLTLSNAFFRPEYFSSLDDSALGLTQSVFRSLTNVMAGQLDDEPGGPWRLLSLGELDSKTKIQGLWTVPSQKMVVMVKSTPNGALIDTMYFEDQFWRSQRTFEITATAGEILENVYTIGFSSLIQNQCILAQQGEGQWTLFHENGSTELDVADSAKLAGAMTRTHMFEDSGKLTFFADGNGYSVNLQEGKITRVDKILSQETIRDNFYGSASSEREPRIASISHLDNSNAFVHGGIAEGFTCEGLPGLWFHKDIVTLGSWEILSPARLLDCLLIADEHTQSLSFLDREKQRKGMEELRSPDMPKFDWLLRLHQFISPDIDRLREVYYNGNETNPIIWEVCITRGYVTPQPMEASFIKLLNLSWNYEFRGRVWEAIGHGDIPG